MLSPKLKTVRITVPFQKYYLNSLSSKSIDRQNRFIMALLNILEGISGF